MVNDGGGRRHCDGWRREVAAVSSGELIISSSDSVTNSSSGHEDAGGFTVASLSVVLSQPRWW